MGRIGAHLSSVELRLLNTLREHETAANVHQLRLASGRRIVAPRDNPSGFVSLSQLQTRQVEVRATADNVSAASSLVSQSQLALDQIRTQFANIRDLLVEDESLSLTTEERAANQAQIDVAIDTISELASQPFDGHRLLDGSTDFRVRGIDHRQIAEVRMNDSGTTAISGEVLQPAARAKLTYTGSAGLVSDDATIVIRGSRGTETIALQQGESLTDLVAEVNRLSHNTGVTADVDGDDVEFRTVNYGAEAEIEIVVSSGVFSVTGGDGNGLAVGTDAVVSLQGADADSGIVSVRGNRASYSTGSESFEVEFAAGFQGKFGSLTVEADPVRHFSLAAASGRTQSLSIRGVLPGQFRSQSGSLTDLLSGGELAGLGTNTSQAIRVVDESLARLTVIEAGVEAFAKFTIDSSAALLTGLDEQFSAAIDALDKPDENEESILLARREALATNAVASLSVLDEQRYRVLDLLHQMAGLA